MSTPQPSRLKPNWTRWSSKKSKMSKMTKAAECSHANESAICIRQAISIAVNNDPDSRGLSQSTNSHSELPQDEMPQGTAMGCNQHIDKKFVISNKENTLTIWRAVEARRVKVITPQAKSCLLAQRISVAVLMCPVLHANLPFSRQGLLHAETSLIGHWSLNTRRRSRGTSDTRDSM